MLLKPYLPVKSYDNLKLYLKKNPRSCIYDIVYSELNAVFLQIITIQGQFTDQLSELQSFTFLDLSKLEKSLDLNILFKFSSCDSDDDKYGLKLVEYSHFRNFMQQKFH